MASHPEDAGFSAKRLEMTRGVLKADVDAKRFPGAVLLIARNGKIVFYDAVGYQERASETPMKKDSIFRVASMSKPYHDRCGDDPGRGTPTRPLVIRPIFSIFVPPKF